VLVPVIACVIVGGFDDSGYKWHTTRAGLFTVNGTVVLLQNLS
jgi:hypothetical protein